MTRQQLEHIIRAAGSVTDENTILILGSQAILGTVGSPSEVLARSIEADVFPLRAPEKMEVINGAIGEITPFQETFGYYAHGLPPEACALPRGWEKRLEPIHNENTRGVTGLCLGAHDLACAKLAAGRPKDLEFVGEMLALKIVAPVDLVPLIGLLPLPEQRQAAWRSLEVACARRGVAFPGHLPA